MSHVPPPWQPAPPHQPAGQFPVQPGGFPASVAGTPTWAGQAGGPPPQAPRGSWFWRMVQWINPAAAAKNALQAQNRLAPPDAKIERVRLIRTLLGMSVVGWVALKYDSVEAEKVFGEAMLHVTISVFVAVLAVPVTALILVLLTDRAKRRDTRRCMRAPMKSMGAFFLAGATLTGLALGKVVEMRPGGALMVLVVLGWFVLIWCGFFAITAFFMVPRHLFAAADGHLLMPCLLAPTLSWAIAVVDLASPGDERVPAVVAAVVTLGAPISITAMSVWEAKRVKDLYGVTFRSGSQPLRFPPPPTHSTQLPHQTPHAAWQPGAAHPTRPFRHTPHIIGVLFTCGLWGVVYLSAYALWKKRQPTPTTHWT